MDRPFEPLVGRHEEISSLWEWLNSGADSLLLEGQTGIGKTSLVRALTYLARREGWTVRVAHCYAAPAPVPFLPVLEMLGSNFPGTPGGFDEEEEPREVRAQFIADLTARVIDGFEGQPALLVVEDVQRADPASLLLLNHLVDVAPKVRLLFTSEITEPKAVSVLLVDLKRKLARLELGPLALEEVGQLAREICGPATLSPREVAWLFGLTGGNPLFAKEVLLDLRKSGLLAHHTASRAAGILGIPADLESVFDRRLAQLGSEDASIVELASALQGPLDEELLAEAAELRPSRIDQALTRAADLGLVGRSRDDEERAYVFAHPFIRHRLYQGLARSGRREAHRRIATACETLHSHVTERAFLAVHLALAGTDSLLTWQASKAAADASERVFGFESAARFWRLAALNAPTPGDKAAAFLRQGICNRATGDWSAAQEALQRAHFRAVETDDDELAASAAFELGEICRYRLDLAGASRWLEECVRYGAPHSRRQIRALALLGSTKAALGQAEEATACISAAMEAASEHESEVPFVAFWASVGYAALGDSANAYAAVSTGLNLARHLRDTQHTALLASLLLQADLAELRTEHVEDALADLASLPEPRDTASVVREMMARTQVLAYSGKWDAVRSLAEGWMAQVRLAGRFQLATAQVCWGVASMWLGEADGGVSALEDAVPDLGPVQALGGLHLARAYWQAGLGRAATEAILANAEAALNTPRSVAARALLGELAWDTRDQLLGERVGRYLCKEQRPAAIGYFPMSVTRVMGRLAALRGDWSEAFARFDEAAGQLTRGAANWELILTYLDHAEVRQVRGRRGDTQRALALQAQAVKILRDSGLAVGALQARVDVARVPPGTRFGLTNRELQILQLVAQGRTNAEIGEDLGISGHTIDRHLENIFVKLGASGRTQAVLVALTEGLIVWP